MRAIALLLLAAFFSSPNRALAQAKSYAVTVNANGSFSPKNVYIKSGDTVRWENLNRTDSIIPVTAADPYPALCGKRAAYDPANPNEFSGPQPFAPSGVFTLGSYGLGFGEGTCTSNAIEVAGGKKLCNIGAYEATMDSTWKSPNVTGVFIRLLWKDVNPSPGVFNFQILQREMEQAVKNGKLFGLAIKAGDDGTPDWIFSTNADSSTRIWRRRRDTASAFSGWRQRRF